MTRSILCFSFAVVIAVVAHAAPGDLDTTFAPDGKFFATVAGATYSSPNAITTDASGNVYIGAETGNASDDFSVIKILPDGALDTTFGSGGKVVVDVGSGSDDKLGGVAVDANGNVFMAGVSDANGSPMQMTVVKLTRSGAVDSSFGVNGRAFAPNGTTNNDSCSGITLDASGALYLTGSSYPSGQENLKIAKLTAAGALDANFGTSGESVVQFGHSTTGSKTLIDGDGSMFVEGNIVTTDSGVVYNMALIHLDQYGNPITTFGEMGAVKFMVNTVNIAADMARDAAGNFYVVGETANASFQNQQFAVVKLDKNGALVTDFGTGGKAAFSYSSGFAIGESVVIDKDGNLYLTGIGEISNNLYTEVMQVDGAAGTLIPTFGTNGQVAIDFLNGDYGGVAGALDASGRLYVTARQGDPTSSTVSEFVAARLVTAPTNEIFSGNFE